MPRLTKTLIALCYLLPLTLPASDFPPLQPLIDKTPEGETLIPEPGIYAGPVVIDKSMILDGQNKVTIDAGGSGSVVVLDTDGAKLRNLHLNNSV